MRQETLYAVFAAVLAFIAITFTNSAHACGEIKPTPEVTKIVKRLAYSTFPQASDIFAVMRIESSMNPDAENVNERESSVGYMQVQNGPKDARTNIAMGVSLLREYYVRFHSKEAAIKSYNIGPATYQHKKAMLNAEAYYDKFLLQKRVYANYAKTGKLVSLGPTLGCGKENGIPQWLQDRLDDYQCHAPIKKKKTTKKHS